MEPLGQSKHLIGEAGMPSHFLRLATFGLALLTRTAGVPADDACRVRNATYNGWKCVELTNGRIDVVVAPQLGGRMIQLRLDRVEYLWVNPDLAGKVFSDAGPVVGADKSAPPTWANYGGDKLWPAPQGWSRPDEWPGPPDPFDKGGTVDHGIYQLRVLASGPDEAAVQLTGPPDTYAGIRFDRTIRIRSGRTTIELTAVMVNTTDKPVRWGIWQVTQHGGHTRTADSPIAWDKRLIDVHAWSPVNPKSAQPQGYKVLFGPKDNPQFVADAGLKTPDGSKMFRLDYAYRVGKVGLDNVAGWLAVTHRKSEYLYAHTFPAQADQEHPDGASVEFWASGPGTIRLGDRDAELGQDQPVLIESEVLSPFARLEPGQRYTYSSKVHLARGGGPVLAVTEAFAVLDLVRVSGRRTLAGRVAVFEDGAIHVAASPDAPWQFLGRVKAGQLVEINELARTATLDFTRAGAGISEHPIRVALIRADGSKVVQEPPLGYPRASEVNTGERGGG